MDLKNSGDNSLPNSDDELSAPVVVACKSNSSNIVDVLSDLLDKAQTELDDTRHAECSQFLDPSAVS